MVFAVNWTALCYSGTGVGRAVCSLFHIFVNCLLSYSLEKSHLIPLECLASSFLLMLELSF